MFTFIQVLVSIAGFYFRAELIPQTAQLPLESFKISHRCLEKARLNDAHFDSKVVYISPGNKEAVKISAICYLIFLQ